MLYVKMMSNELKLDNHPCKQFSILTLQDNDELTFNTAADDHGNSVPAMYITKADGTVIERILIGNVYVMNDAGKTIASHSI